MSELISTSSLPDRVDIAHDLPYDPTCGYDLKMLSAVRPPETVPGDFTTFWEKTYQEARHQDDRLGVELRGIEVPIAGVCAHEVSFTSWEGFRTGGWLVEPTAAQPRGLMVHGHGYAGLDSPDFSWARRGFAVLFVCARGFNRSARAGWPNEARSHVVHGVEDRWRYILRGCVVELWQAASILVARYPELEDRLVYFGHSFGGGLGALMLPWDDRYKRAYLGVPTFGHHPLRLKYQRGGAGQSLRDYWLAHPDIEAVLPYYDAAIAGTYIQIPVLTEVAMFDPDVCPPGQWAVANSIQSARSVTQVIPCAHFDTPPELLSRAERVKLGRNVIDFLLETTRGAGSN